jgi:hypothetical protein
LREEIARAYLNWTGGTSVFSEVWLENEYATFSPAMYSPDD